MLKRAESHHCDVNTSGNLACNFSTLFKVFQRDSFQKSLTESERNDRF